MERLRLDATARLAGHAVVETGTHVEILREQGGGRPPSRGGRRVRAAGSCGCGRVRRLPGRRASPLIRGRDVARQVTLGAGSAAPNTSGEASSLESVSRGVCAGAAVRREQARDRETVRREMIALIRL